MSQSVQQVITLTVLMLTTLAGFLSCMLMTGG
jgi:hypothetical protein